MDGELNLNNINVTTNLRTPTTMRMNPFVLKGSHSGSPRQRLICANLGYFRACATNGSPPIMPVIAHGTPDHKWHGLGF